MTKSLTVPNFPGVTVSVEVVDRARAAAYLAQNTHNRPLRIHHARNLADALSRGEFTFTGAALVFDRDGVLIDGQHRCEAIVQTNVAATMVVVRGVHPDVQHVIDTGSVRSPRDQVELAGIDNSSRMTALAIALYQYERGLIRRTNGGVGEKPSTLQILDLCEKRVGMPTAVDRGRRVAAALGGSPAMHSLAAYLFAEKNPDAADEFFDLLATGVGLDAGSPILAARNFFVGAASRRDRLERKKHLGVLVKAWNLWRSGATIQRLGFRSDEELPEPRS